jgi:hypothetical protein
MQSTKNDGSRKVQVKVLMTKDEHKKLKGEAAEYGVSLADLVRLRSLNTTGLPTGDGSGRRLP